MEQITKFRGRHSFLSNMYPCKIFYMQHVFPSVENAYQAMKSDNPDAWKLFVNYLPKQSKTMGKKLSLRPNWNKDKLGFMYILIDKKFNDMVLGRKLLDTGDAEIIEGNTWNDTYWGQCPVGNGENNLGKILMQKRESLRLGW